MARSREKKKLSRSINQFNSIKKRNKCTIVLLSHSNKCQTLFHNDASIINQSMLTGENKRFWTTVTHSFEQQWHLALINCIGLRNCTWQSNLNSKQNTRPQLRLSKILSWDTNETLMACTRMVVIVWSRPQTAGEAQFPCTKHCP